MRKHRGKSDLSSFRLFPPRLLPSQKAFKRVVRLVPHASMNPDRRSYRPNTYASFALEGLVPSLSFPPPLFLSFFFIKSDRCILMSNYSVSRSVDQRNERQQDVEKKRALLRRARRRRRLRRWTESQKDRCRAKLL